jgi:hypothetical protein
MRCCPLPREPYLYGSCAGVFEFLRSNGLERTLSSLRQELASQGAAAAGVPQTAALTPPVGAAEQDLLSMMADLGPPAKPLREARGARGLRCVRAPAAAPIVPFQPLQLAPKVEMAVEDCAVETISLSIIYQRNRSGFEKQADCACSQPFRYPCIVY